MKKLFLISIVLFGVLLIACNTVDDTCRKSKDVSFNVGFYIDSISATHKLFTTTKLKIDSLTAKGVGRDSLLYRKATTTQIKLPLNKFSEKSAFAITFNDAIDTLEVIYKNETEYLSLSCGTIRTYVVDTAFAKGHFIDSISITNKNVNTSNVENLQIHRFK